MTDDEKDIEIVRLRRSERRSKYLICFMAGVMVAQILVAIDGMRTLRRTNDTMMSIADTRDIVIAENEKLRAMLKQQKDEEDEQIRRGVWMNLPMFVGMLDDDDIAKLRAIRKRQLQPAPVEQTH